MVDKRQKPQTKAVSFDRTLTLLMDTLASDHNRRVTEALTAAAKDRGYRLGPGGVEVDLDQRVWIVPVDGDDAS